MEVTFVDELDVRRGGVCLLGELFLEAEDGADAGEVDVKHDALFLVGDLKGDLGHNIKK